MTDKPANKWPIGIAVNTRVMPAEAMLEDLQAQLEYLTTYAGQIADKLEVEKKKAAPVTPLKAKERYGFLLPNRTSTDFNTASAVETKVLPSDVYKFTGGAELEDYQTVLKALADPATRESNRNAIFLDNPDKGPSLAANRAVIDSAAMAEGKAPIGLNFTVVTASSMHSALVDLCVIEDKERGKMLVVGDKVIPPEFRAQLKEKGVEYVTRKEPHTVALIDQFLAESAKWRGEQGKLIVGNSNDMIKGLLYAVARYTCAVETAYASTVGIAINGETRPKRSAQITRPR